MQFSFPGKKLEFKNYYFYFYFECRKDTTESGTVADSVSSVDLSLLLEQMGELTQSTQSSDSPKPGKTIAIKLLGFSECFSSV